MDVAANIRKLLSVALDEFDQPTTTVSASARRALRIAALRRDYVNELWLQWELTDLNSSLKQKWQDPAISRIKSKIDALLGADRGRKEGFRAYLQFERNRTFVVNDEDVIVAPSLGQIEQRLAMSRRVYDDLTAPSNLTQIDTYFFARDADSAKAKLIPSIHDDEQVLERVKTAIHSFLVATESELDEGQQEAQLFLHAQEYINSALAKHAPKALETFLAAQDRLYSGNAEDLTHALTSCRRMIKALADSLYPATGEVVTDENGIKREMSDDAYRNRLLQYVAAKLGKHVHSEVIRATIESLGGRLKSLDSLASKGVHSDVTTAEAETCVIWTYFLAAELVRIADGTSSLLLSREAKQEHTSED